MEKQDKIALIAVICLVCACIFALMYLTKILGGWFFDIDDLGYGFKEALPIAVILSFVIITIFALFGGDGIIFGEIPFMIAGFFIFVLFFTISLAWLY